GETVAGPARAGYRRHCMRGALRQHATMTALLIASTMFVALGVLVRASAKWRGSVFGPSDDMLYSDAGRSTVELLVSDRYQLIGRPDYVLEDGTERIPVERKDRLLTHS